MQEDLEIQTGLDEDALVERVVPGRLVYVIKASESHDFLDCFKLDQMVIRQPDGYCRPYRGESLSDLGLGKGSRVVIRKVGAADTRPTLVVDAGLSREAGIGNSISSAVSATFAKFLR
jgi:hypothetical protein